MRVLDEDAEHRRFGEQGLSPNHVKQFEGVLTARFFFVQDPDGGYNVEVLQRYGRRC